ncbi:MAG TPA: hypothetical protein VKZ96_03140 [Thermomicrobiales bacterium]|nr:hypothetical protein [Thermomicrobiales bacterium]
MLSTIAGVTMALTLVIGFSVFQVLARRRALSSDAPPYFALHV